MCLPLCVCAYVCKCVCVCVGVGVCVSAELYTLPYKKGWFATQAADLTLLLWIPPLGLISRAMSSWDCGRKSREKVNQSAASSVSYSDSAPLSRQHLTCAQRPPAFRSPSSAVTLGDNPQDLGSANSHLIPCLSSLDINSVSTFPWLCQLTCYLDYSDFYQALRAASCPPCSAEANKPFMLDGVILMWQKAWLNGVALEGYNPEVNLSMP